MVGIILSVTTGCHGLHGTRMYPSSTGGYRENAGFCETQWSSLDKTQRYPSMGFSHPVPQALPPVVGREEVFIPADASPMLDSARTTQRYRGAPLVTSTLTPASYERTVMSTATDVVEFDESVPMQLEESRPRYDYFE